MVRRYISSREFLAFLQANSPISYRKYKNASDQEFSDMKEDDARQRSLYTLLNKMGVSKGYHHGDIIEFIDDGFRNRGLLFWDAIKGKVVPPTYEFSEATLPTQFIVGEGFFNPDYWDSLESNPVRPCKSLIKDIKTYFTTHPEELMHVVINRKKYIVKRIGSKWDTYEWNKMVLVPEVGTSSEGKVLELDNSMTTESKSVNEEKLRELLQGDNIKRNITRKLDLETKLKAAEQRLAIAMAEVERLRSELDGIGKRGTRYINK